MCQSLERVRARTEGCVRTRGSPNSVGTVYCTVCTVPLKTIRRAISVSDDFRSTVGGAPSVYMSGIHAVPSMCGHHIIVNSPWCAGTTRVALLSAVRSLDQPRLRTRPALATRRVQLRYAHHAHDRGVARGGQRMATCGSPPSMRCVGGSSLLLLLLAPPGLPIIGSCFTSSRARHSDHASPARSAEATPA